MTSLAAAILDHLQPCPLSLTELLEDFGIEEWEGREMKRALRELERSGKVRRLDASGRDEYPFYGRNLNEKKPGD
ncbi:MAG: hypothetical protein AB7U82_08295 [Blastocatellales bacterium]